MTLIKLRGFVWKTIMEFREKLEDEASKLEFEPVVQAFREYDYDVQTKIDNPVRNITHEYIDLGDHIYEAPNPSVIEHDILIKNENEWFELENGDFLNLNAICYVSKNEKRILFNGDKWTPVNTLTDKDLTRLRYLLQFKKFK